MYKSCRPSCRHVYFSQLHPFSGKKCPVVRQPLAEDTGLTIQKRINTSALYIHKMKWFARAILPVVLLVSGLLVDTSVSAQPCGPGKISKTIQGFGSIVTVDNAYNGNTGINALGGPDGNGAYFTNNGQYIVIDLLDTSKSWTNLFIYLETIPGNWSGFTALVQRIC